MKLLNDIIDLLSDKAGSLTDAMLKTKVLMHKIGHKELADWVNDELNGYGEGRPVPPYRVVGVRLLGNVQNAAWKATDYALPTSHLPDEMRKNVSRTELQQSIGVLEAFAASTGGGLRSQIPPELYLLLAKPFDSAWITNAWTQIEPTQVLNVIIEVRSRLLDFVLNLQGELGDVPEEGMKEAAKEIDAGRMFNAAVFGDNTTVIVGHNNAATITNTVTKGDFNSLAETLKKAGVDDADAEELRAAIDDDDAGAVAKDKRYGPKVKAWMNKMMGKAIDGAWKVGIAAGGKLLADAVGGYYGIGS